MAMATNADQRKWRQMRCPPGTAGAQCRRPAFPSVPGFRIWSAKSGIYDILDLKQAAPKFRGIAEQSVAVALFG